jgi:hypothetical protein
VFPQYPGPVPPRRSVTRIVQLLDRHNSATTAAMKDNAGTEQSEPHPNHFRYTLLDIFFFVLDSLAMSAENTHPSPFPAKK